MRSEEPCNLVTAAVARLLAAIVSSTELLSPVMCHVMCHESNLECTHCVIPLILLELESGDSGGCFPPHLWRQHPWSRPPAAGTPIQGYSGIHGHGDAEHGYRAAAKTVHLMVIMITLHWFMVTGDSLAAWHLAVTGSDVVYPQHSGRGSISPLPHCCH